MQDGAGNAYRFTPTRVGRLFDRRTIDPRVPVHPHTRGEIGVGRALGSSDVGSPPHAWGDWAR